MRKVALPFSSPSPFRVASPRFLVSSLCLHHTSNPIRIKAAIDLNIPNTPHMSNISIMRRLTPKQRRATRTAERNCAEVVDEIETFAYDSLLYGLHVIEGVETDVLRLE